MMRRKINMVFLIIFLCSLNLLLFAVWKLLGTYVEYRQGAETYEELQDYIQKPDGDKRKDTPEEHDTRADDTENGYLQVDFDGLKKVNTDVAAWLYIPALEASYPVVQGEDNYYYLHHMFDGKENKSGSIFIDCHNKPDFTDRNTIVYGHNMNDESMFGTLEWYQNLELYQQYPYFYIYVPGYILEYQIISCYAGRNGSVGYTYSFPQIEDFKEFLNLIQSYAGYNTGTKTADSDHIVTLSTCVNSDGNYRYLVHGKLMRKIQNKEN